MPKALPRGGGGAEKALATLASFPPPVPQGGGGYLCQNDGGKKKVGQGDFLFLVSGFSDRVGPCPFQKRTQGFNFIPRRIKNGLFGFLQKEG
jgi:hypothetical protein